MKYSDFQKYLIEELEELGEIPLSLVLRKYIEWKKNMKHIDMQSIHDYISSSEFDFEEIENQLNDLENELDFDYYVDTNNDIARTWNERYRLLSTDEVKMLFSNKYLWTGSNKDFIVFLATKD